MLLPNSFTHASYTHQLYNCSGNERAKAANWYGNNISSPATLATPSNHNCSVYVPTYATHTHKCRKKPWTEIKASVRTGNLSFLVGLIQIALCFCVTGTLEVWRWSNWIIMPFIVSQTAEGHNFLKQNLYIFINSQKGNMGSFQKAVPVIFKVALQ